VVNSHLLTLLRVPGLDVKEVFDHVGAAVSHASGRKQIPAIYSQYFGKAYFGSRPVTAMPPAPVVQPPPQPEPVPQPAPVAAVQPTPSPAPAVQPVPSPQPVIQPEIQPVITAAVIAPEFQQSSIPENMVYIDGSSFTMGSPRNEAGREANERQRQITVNSFYMGMYEVTQKEYRDVMGLNPSRFKRDNLPVERVSWFEAIEYCNRRSRREGLTPAYVINQTKGQEVSRDSIPVYTRDITWNRNANGYRLPTEAEWEYACRAGTTTPFSTGDNITTDQSNYNGNFPYKKNPKGENRHKTTPVGSFAANPWGLYDMHGNVWEWCWDRYNYYDWVHDNPVGADSGDNRVIRGGSWNRAGEHLRSAERYRYSPSGRLSAIGFRLVRNAQPALRPVPDFTVQMTLPSQSVTSAVSSKQNIPAMVSRPVDTIPVSGSFVRINGGTFIMGSPASEHGHRANEEPQRHVTVDSYYMGKYEVTQKEYREVMDKNPSRFIGDYLPVDQVSWLDAIEYCNRLSNRDGLVPAYSIKGSSVIWNRYANGYRLPTEAEWEYACRAGTVTAYYTGAVITDETGWHIGNSGRGGPHIIGIKPPNPWGLYDMHGNVMEWCWDRYGNYSITAQTDPVGVTFGVSRIARSGSWNRAALGVRSAARAYGKPSGRYIDMGFRLVLPMESLPQHLIDEIVITTPVLLEQSEQETIPMIESANLYKLYNSAWKRKWLYIT